MNNITRVLKPCFYTHVDALVLSVASVSFSAHMIQIDTLNLSYYYHKIRDCINEGKHVWFTVWNRLRIHLFVKFITITILKYTYVSHTAFEQNMEMWCDFSSFQSCELLPTVCNRLLWTAVNLIDAPQMGCLQLKSQRQSEEACGKQKAKAHKAN